MKRDQMIIKGLFVAACAMVIAGAAAITNTTAQVAPAASATFAVGQGPEGVITNGTHVFVANQFSNAVMNL